MSRGDPLGYFEGDRDPGNLRYYARMREHRDWLNSVLLPIGGRVSYVGMLNGSISVLWYFGRNETGCAGGRTPEAVLESIYAKIFGGL